jgi:hypothetical protein
MTGGRILLFVKRATSSPKEPKTNISILYVCLCITSHVRSAGTLPRPLKHSQHRRPICNVKTFIIEAYYIIAYNFPGKIYKLVARDRNAQT